MGKSGDALRAMKKQRVTYTFTREQLEEHDRQVRMDFRKEYERMAKQYMASQRDEMIGRVNEEWNNRAAEFQTGIPEDNFNKLLSFTLAVPARVLVEHFGWTPVRTVTGRTGNNRLARFGDLIVSELERISRDDNEDIRSYCKRTEEEYGISFRYAEEDDA